MIPKLSQVNISHHASKQSFERGQGYYRNGSVGCVIQRGNVLSGEVEGSDVEPYRIRIDFDQGGITKASCSCPYDYEGWCKHIVATLLFCLHNPEGIEEREELSQQLKALGREQLQVLIENLVKEQPEWIEEIEEQIRQITQVKPKKNPKMTRQTLIEPKPIQRQVERIVDSYVGQWDDDPALAKIGEILEKAHKFMKEGDGNNGLIMVGAIVRGYVKTWMNLDGSSGLSGDFFDELDEGLTEGILSAHLSESEGQKWRKSLEKWQAEVDDYGVESFEMSLTALEQGWESGPLQRVLQGELREGIYGDSPRPDFAAPLAQIRLKILARQGRDEEYLYLAQAEGQTEQYLEMLAKLGRTEEALVAAQEQMKTTEEALSVAQTLREKGNLEQALIVGNKGLSLGGDQKYNLSVWVSELAEGLGESQKALESRITAFKTQPSLPDYLKVQELAPEQWVELRQELLSKLRKASNHLDAESKVAIFLYEELIDDAIATVDKLSSYESSTIHQVMDVAMAYRPDWVRENARPRAESILNEGKAKYYHHAINWLRQVRKAYQKLGELEEWQNYRKTLMETHSRKRKFVSLMGQKKLI